ncbi:MAG: hypothetical protein Tsb002_10450 [Wenzhouxiangellaceae bacterium]
MIVGKNNCGRIVIKGSNESTIRIGEGNKAQICIENDNEATGTIVIGKDNRGEIKIDDVNQGHLEVGDNNVGEIVIGNDNEGQIKVGDHNSKAIKVGDVNQGTISVGDDNTGEVCIDDDNERIICVGDDNDAAIKIGDANQGSIKVGARNCGDISVKDDNEGTIATGDGDMGSVSIGGDNEGSVEQSNCSSCRAFFDDYDRCFMPAAPPAPRKPLQDEVERLIGGAGGPGILLRRFGARRRRAAGVAPPPAIPAPNAADKAAVRALSDGQKKLFEDHFKKPDGNIDVECVQICFNAFANGELRDPGTADGAATRPGEPDGDFFFLFAEYALLAIECNSNKDFWNSVLPSLVKAQEIFIEVYPPIAGLPGQRRAFRGPAVSKAKKKTLHDKYAAKTLAQVADCYNDNLARAQRQPAVAMRPSSPRERALRGRLLAAVAETVEGLRWLATEVDQSRERQALWQRGARLASMAQQLVWSQFDQAQALSYLGAASNADAPVLLPPSYIEGVSERVAGKLAASGLQTLMQLAAVDPAADDIAGVSRKRLTTLRDTARLKLAYPQLSAQDIELIVVGLGLNSVAAVVAARQTLTSGDLTEARQRTRLPADYQDSNVRQLFAPA